MTDAIANGAGQPAAVEDDDFPSPGVPADVARARVYSAIARAITELRRAGAAWQHWMADLDSETTVDAPTARGYGTMLDRALRVLTGRDGGNVAAAVEPGRRWSCTRCDVHWDANSIPPGGEYCAGCGQVMTRTILVRLPIGVLVRVLADQLWNALPVREFDELIARPCGGCGLLADSVAYRPYFRSHYCELCVLAWARAVAWYGPRVPIRFCSGHPGHVYAGSHHVSAMTPVYDKAGGASEHAGDPQLVAPAAEPGPTVAPEVQALADRTAARASEAAGHDE
jgi:hypothetical protein